MDKKAIIAFVIIGLLIIMYPYYLKVIAPPRSEFAPEVAPEQRGVSRDSTKSTEESILSNALLDEKIEEAEALFTSDDTLGIKKEIVVDTDLYRARISTLGGTIQSWQLKFFEGLQGEWVELVPDKATGALAIIMNTNAGAIDLSNYVFSCETENVLIDRNNPSQSIQMVLQLQNGRRVEKEFTFRQGQYSFELKILIEGFENLVPTREYELIWKPGLMFTEKDVKEDMSKMAVFALMGDAVAKYDFGRKEQTLERKEDGATNWVGIRTKYFLMSMISRIEQAKGLMVRGTKRRVHEGKNAVDIETFETALRMPLHSNGPTGHNFEIYIGPQDYSLLRKYGVGLEGCMDMGWALIQPVSRLILAFFVFLHRFIPNYGLIIIIFSIVLKIVFYPLTHKQLEATRKMQQLQPQLAALKEKYKNDPQRLNKETMALYKKGGANPLGGCFPLLLQMPIFFALFSVFRSTIELRRAGFVFWIKDLSVKDPYLVLPIIMAVTMFIQQKMTVKDPKQAAMVYLMPAIMFFFFMNFASGLVLYWTVFNVLSIIQQLFIERKEAVGSQK
ncbi:MAG: membrane protein insertase YidC [Gemmatimonadota bacterium]|nr:MAG: membrane protein insertase YidC [Gemmatimonadota bacterium]